MKHKEWYSRGYLPHFDHVGVTQMINFRLADALPLQFLEHLETVEKENDPERRKRIEAYLDAGHGSCILRDSRIGGLVEDALPHFDAYQMIEWVVMPNHVHTLVKIHPDFLLPDVLQSWKSFTAHEANPILDKSGKFWEEEYSTGTFATQSISRMRYAIFERIQ